MKYYIIAGEASGDMHGANLMRHILEYDAEADFRFFGGDMMKSIRGSLVRHYSEMSYMGIWEVVRNAGKISRNVSLCKSDIIRFNPDIIILIDYAGFNLRIARYAKAHNLKVYYYILPKLWAWGKSRVKKIKKYVDKRFAILPFEVGFYNKLNVDVEFYGNPLVEEIENFKRYSPPSEDFRNINKLSDKPIIALLAGSRKQEIDRCLPEMTAITKYYPDYQFVVAGAVSIEKEYYYKTLQNTDIKIVHNQTYPLLTQAAAAVVTSGTATLETALFNIPQVVIYKTSGFTYYFGQLLILIRVIHVKFFSLVNIILNKEAVKELLQFRLADNIKKELDKILFDRKYREEMIKNYTELRNIIGKPEASKEIARRIVESLG
ncbi:MAG: lipid-A-disaccharide synthase [Bacteroidales bacterium]|nr:MAG: lipid-A-disaccharide synthase [Bacteroidales bacterium]